MGTQETVAVRAVGTARLRPMIHGLRVRRQAGSTSFEGSS